MASMRAPLEEPVAQDSERQALSDVLWSFHFHGAGLNSSAVPSALRPIPLADAIDAATRWNDEHAHDRRIRTLRRLDRTFLAAFEEAPDLKRARRSLKNFDVEDLAPRYSRKHRVNLSTVRPLVSQVGNVMDNPEHTRCLPSADRPGYDPKRGRTFLLSKLTVHRQLDHTLVCLLDPRCWDNCSDLFKKAERVERAERGGYVRVHPNRDPNPIGTPWNGYLYELAGVGPQLVENILHVDFAVTRECSGRGAKLPHKCKAGTCGHDATNVNVDYRLYDSLSYQLGGLVFPGVMRQNYGYFKAERKGQETHIECKKTIRFGRLTDWSAGGGAFDYGEVLNYTAPAYLSLWIYDVTQIVPCCKKIKKLRTEAEG